MLCSGVFILKRIDDGSGIFSEAANLSYWGASLPPSEGNRMYFEVTPQSAAQTAPLKGEPIHGEKCVIRSREQRRVFV